MEQKSPKHESTAKGQESLSYQRRMWKNFQEKTKPWLSPKLGSERRGTGGAEGSKKESGLWMFKRKKKQLDRFFSSSQPNLYSSTPAPFEGDKSLGSDAVPGTSSDEQPLLHPLGAASRATGSKPELTAHGSPKLPVSQLIMYQQKSSSLGSACFEKLVMDPAAVMEEEERLRKNASDSVSKEHIWQNTHLVQFLLLPSEAIAKMKIHKEAGWATMSWKLNEGDKFYDGGAATCSLLVSCDHRFASSLLSLLCPVACRAVWAR